MLRYLITLVKSSCTDLNRGFLDGWEVGVQALY